MSGAISSFDSYWFHRLNDWTLQPNWAVWLFIIALYGIAVYLVIFVWLWFRSDNKKTEYHDQRSVVLATLAVFLTMLVSQISDVIINRPRPAVFYQDVTAFNVLIDQASFPSLHTSVAFGITAMFWLLGYKKLAASSLILAVAIGISRIATGVHYPTDIIGGVALGWLSAWVVYKEAGWLRDYLPKKERK